MKGRRRFRAGNVHLKFVLNVATKRKGEALEGVLEW